MRRVAFLIIAGSMLLLPSVRSAAYQPPTTVPGGRYPCTLYARNPLQEPLVVSARVRLHGSRYWNRPGATEVGGSWIEVPEQTLAPSETRTVDVELPVPDQAPDVVSVEIRERGGGFWGVGDLRHVALVIRPPSPPRESRDVPFRIVGGGKATYRPEEEPHLFGAETREETVDDETEWEDLRDRFGIIAPDSWGVHPAEGDLVPADGLHHRADFAAPGSPDFAEETLLAIRTASHSLHVRPLRLFVRSVTTRGDGSVLCRYSYRFERVSGPVFGLLEEGRWLLLAIPRTDAPVVFRRVP
jgi:hypothetical protein